VFAELHARSAFSFLEGACSPEDLVARAAELEIPAVALLDRDGLYGAPRFHLAAKKAGLRAHIGAEVTLAGGGRCPLLVETRAGYRNLCRLITRMKLRSRKGEGSVTLEEVAEHAGGLVALVTAEGAEAMQAVFGRGQVYAEVQRHLERDEEARNQHTIDTARRLDIPLLATNGPSYAHPAQRQVMDVFTSLRHHVRLDTAGRLPALAAVSHDFH